MAKDTRPMDMRIPVAPLLKHPIGTHEDHHVSEDPIDPRGQNAELAEAGFASFDARLRATHTDPGVLVEGTASGSTAQQCSRCLRPTTTPVATEFAEQYYATVGVVSGEPLPGAPSDAKVIGTDFRIDLAPLIREELILATPLASVCRPDCRGLCPECGEDLNERPHEHDRPIDDRWAALRKLRTDDDA